MTHDATGPQHRDQRTELDRQAAFAAFLGAGLPRPPATALLVQALADARRAIAMHGQRGLAVDQWLAAEIRQRGIKENAAVLAVLEIPERREETAAAYRQQHPDRTGALNDLLSALDRT